MKMFSCTEWLHVAGAPEPCCNLRHVHLLHTSALLHLQLHLSNMEALGGYPSKASSSRARVVPLILTATLCITSFYLLHAKISRNRKHADFYSFQVKDTKGRSVSLEKYRGKVSFTTTQTSMLCFISVFSRS